MVNTFSLKVNFYVQSRANTDGQIRYTAVKLQIGYSQLCCQIFTVGEVNPGTGRHEKLFPFPEFSRPWMKKTGFG